MKLAVLTAGLGWGDEGKGSIVDAVTRALLADLVVRYNGGAQAGHHVVTPTGNEHCFAQFGAGTLAGARTYLGPSVVVDPLAFEREAVALTRLGVPEPAKTVTVDINCPLVTPWHKALNRLREAARGDGRHGSCGRGIGEVQQERSEGIHPIRVAELILKPSVAKEMAEAVRDRARRISQAIMDAAIAAGQPFNEPNYDAWGVKPWLEAATQALSRCTFATGPKALLEAETVVFEGAQGVLLDERYGFHPHTTWSDCTLGGAEELLRRVGWLGGVLRVGVLRTYATRHGAGPFPTEVLAGGIDPHERNRTDTWQGAFRTGHFDAVLARYALARCPVDVLALTHCDAVTPSWQAADAYTHATWDRAAKTIDLIERPPGIKYMQEIGESLRLVSPRYDRAIDNDVVGWVEESLGVPVAIESHGPTAADKRWRDPWVRQVEARRVDAVHV